MGIETIFGDSIITTRLDKIINWGRRWSLWQYPFHTACCAIEWMSALGSHYDFSRFGAELPRFSPRQADLLMIGGTINHKIAPVLKLIHEQMCEPKWVIALGACACSGGFYDNYAVVQSADLVIPVDVYVGGCPPRPEAMLDGLMRLQEKIDKESVLQYR